MRKAFLNARTATAIRSFLNTAAHSLNPINKTYAGGVSDTAGTSHKR